MIGRINKTARRALGPSSLDEADLVFRLLSRYPPGVLIEVGAHQGDETFMLLANAGWEIHAFEPDPANRADLEAKLVDLPNVTVIPKAVSDFVGVETLYRSAESTGISSLKAFTKGHAAAGEVEVTTLTEYVADHGPSRVDFLKVDVEGHEKNVLAGYPWETHRPRAILLEFEDRKTLQLGYTWRDLAQEITGRGYSVLVSEWHPIERYGVTHKWRRFASYPTDLKDADGWGNLVAVESSDFPQLQRLSRAAARRLKVRHGVDYVRKLGRTTDRSSEEAC